MQSVNMIRIFFLSAIQIPGGRLDILEMTFPHCDLVTLALDGCAVAIVELLILSRRSSPAYLSTEASPLFILAPTSRSSCRRRHCTKVKQGSR